MAVHSSLFSLFLMVSVVEGHYLNYFHHYLNPSPFLKHYLPTPHYPVGVHSVLQPLLARPTVCRPDKPCPGGHCCLRSFHAKCYYNLRKESDTCLTKDGLTDRCTLSSQCAEGQTCQGARSNLWGHCRGNPCDTGDPCNGGTCTPHGADFVCECTADKKGERCELSHECAQTPTPCGDTGECVRSDDTWRCECHAGWTGANCNVETLPADHPCNNPATCNGNKGKCEAKKFNQYKCYCMTPWTGTQCSVDSSSTVSDPCAASPCKNGGQCVPGQGVQFTCQCTSQWVGATCEQASPCVSNPCQNSGECVLKADPTQYVCDCADGFEGDHCEKEDACSTTANPCNGQGTCTSLAGGKFSCECNPGWIGATCNEDDPCLDVNPCENGGKCVPESATDFACCCADDWGGPTCEIDATDACATATNPCNGNGNCISLPNNQFQCTCWTDWIGEFCAEDDPCLPDNPCKNSGKCVSTSASDFDCCCEDGWGGPTCELDTTRGCDAATPCSGHGACTDGYDGAAICTCDANWAGATCHLPIPVLSVVPASAASGAIELVSTDVTFTCDTGDPSITGVCKIKLDGDVIWQNTKAATNGVYTISFDQLTKTDSGAYTCTVEVSGEESPPSNTVTLDVIEKPPSPTLLISTNEADNGGELVLICQSATPSITGLSFKKDGDVIRTVNDGAIAEFGIHPLSLDDNGNYSCCALNDSVQSEDSNVEPLLVKPILTQSPSKEDFIAGEEVTFTCEATSTETITYKLYRDDQEVVPAFTSDNTHVVTVADADNAGDYHCTAETSNSFSTSSSVTVDFVDKPDKPTLTVQTSTPTDGGTVVLTCASSAGVTAFEFRQGSTVLGTVHDPDTHNAAHVILAATIDVHDAEPFSCVALTDTVTSDPSDPVTVALHPQTPDLTESNTDLDVNAGDTYTLTCATASTSTSLITYIFFRNGIEITARPEPARSATYTLDPVALEHTGEYHCKATIKGKTSELSLPQELNVVEDTSVAQPTLEVDNTTALDGTSLTLTCASDTAGVTSYSFLRDGVPLLTQASPILIYNPAEISVHNGDYTCTATKDAETSHQSDATTVTLTPLTPSLTVSPSLDQLPARTDATFTCHTLSSATPVTYKFFKENGQEVGSSSDGVYVRDNLQTTDTDSYTCTAEIDGGTSDISGSVDLTVVDIPPCFSDHTFADGGFFCTKLNINPTTEKMRDLNLRGGQSNCVESHHEAHLPRVHNQEELDEIIAVRANYPYVNGGGGHTVEDLEIWLFIEYRNSQWVDFWTDEPIPWTNWDTNEPDMSQPAYTCAAVKMNGKWRTRDCTSDAMVICEMAPFDHYCPKGCSGKGNREIEEETIPFPKGKCTYSGAATDFYCDCPVNFYGDACQEICGGDKGVLAETITDFPSETYTHPIQCLWIYQSLDTDSFFPYKINVDGVIGTDGPPCDEGALKIYMGDVFNTKTVEESTLVHDLCGTLSATDDYLIQRRRSLLVLFDGPGNSATVSSVRVSLVTPGR